MDAKKKDLFTDSRHLQTAAYPDSSNLRSRINIYTYQQPPIDLVALALDQVDWRGDERVADVGCGPGLYLQRLAQRAGLRLIGLDLSRGMLADLRRDWNPAFALPSLSVADVQALPLRDRSCDVLLAMHMLYHAADIQRAIVELRRVLRPGGVLLALTNSMNHTRELRDVYDAALLSLGAVPVPEGNPARHFTSEDGAVLLGNAFAEVERHDFESALVVPEAAPVVRYIQSTRSTRQDALPIGLTWDALTVEIERLITETIVREGAFRIRTAGTLFLCR